jgi:WD40 repeat protein
VALQCRITGLKGGWLLRTFEGNTDRVRSVAFSPCGHYCLSGSDDKTLKLWEVATGRHLRTFEGHTDNVYSVAFSPDGRYALSGSSDKTLKLWEVDSGRFLRTFKGHTDWVYSVSFSPCGRYCLSGSRDDTLKLWEVASGRLLRTFEGHTGDIYSVAFSSDGHYILSGSRDKTLTRWDLSTSECLRTFEGPKQGVDFLSFSPDGRYCLSSYVDNMEFPLYSNTLQLLEVVSGRVSRTCTFEGETNSDYGPVTSVAFSPDGYYCLAGSWDGSLKIWEVSTGWPGQASCTFESHTRQVLSVAFPPCGRYCLSGSDDRTLKLWELDWAYEFPGWADWDAGAEPYLRHFLARHTPYAAALQAGRAPSPEEVTAALTRQGKPAWTEEDFTALLMELSRRGYGWLKPEGVRRKLEEMAKTEPG